MIDVRKLKAFVESPMSLGEPLSAMQPDLSPTERAEIEHELKDATSHAAETARKLAPNVTYLEVLQPAGAFSCGNCKFAKRLAEGAESDEEEEQEPLEDEEEEGAESAVFCSHVEVRADVSGGHGCCNYFAPSPTSGVELTFPPQDEE